MFYFSGGSVLPVSLNPKTYNRPEYAFFYLIVLKAQGLRFSTLANISVSEKISSGEIWFLEELQARAPRALKRERSPIVKINRLSLDDVQLYGRDEREIDSLVETVRISSNTLKWTLVQY